MKTKFIESGQGPAHSSSNWGKFMIGEMDEKDLDHVRVLIKLTILILHRVAFLITDSTAR